MKKLLLSALAMASAWAVQAQCNEVFISEYVEGSGNDKAIEIYNPTAQAINLEGYELVRYSNGSRRASDRLNLLGSIPAYGTFVVANGQTTDEPLNGGSVSPKCDANLQKLANQLDKAYPAPTYFNGNDALTIEKDGNIVDVFGKIGDPDMVTGQGWKQIGTNKFNFWTTNHTLVRKATVKDGIKTSPAAFDPALEYDSLPNGSWSGLGQHTCDCKTNQVSVTQLAKQHALVIYPSPAVDGVFRIKAWVDLRAIAVYDLTGAQISATVQALAPNNWQVTLPAPGRAFYIVKAQTTNGTTIVQKVMGQ